MSMKAKFAFIAYLIVFFGLLSKIVFWVASAKVTGTVTYDYYVVAGYEMEPTPPNPAPSPQGFLFTGASFKINSTGTFQVGNSTVYNFGSITKFGRLYLYEGAAGTSYGSAYAVVNITNLLGYDITITNLTVEVTAGTPTKDFYFSPANTWFGNWTMVWVDTLDPWSPENPKDEVDYYTGQVKYVIGGSPGTDCDWWTKAVREPCDANTGPASLLEPDLNGDANATGHVAPVQLAAGETLTEYFGVIIFGDVDPGTQIEGTITLTLEYEYVIPGSPVAWFTYTPTDIIAGDVVTFDASNSTANGGNITSYKWDFGDGFTGSGKIVNHTYSAAGTYMVVLNVTDSEGLWDTKELLLLRLGFRRFGFGLWQASWLL